ncbi:MAG: hypothetical protein ACOYOO_07895 [Saprospiraceae bacterium]
MRQFNATLLLAVLLASAVSCKKEPDARAEMLLGRWVIREGFRNGQATESLSELFFEFGKDGRMSTNLPLPELSAKATYVLGKDKIVQRQGEAEVEYVIKTLSDSLLIVTTRMRNYDFRFVLKKN